MITKKYKNPSVPEVYHLGWGPMRFGKGIDAPQAQQAQAQQAQAQQAPTKSAPCSYTENRDGICAMCKYGSPIDEGFVCLAPKIKYSGEVKGLEPDAEGVGVADEVGVVGDVEVGVDTVVGESLPFTVPLGTVTTSPTLTRLELRSDLAPLPMLGEFSPQERRELRRLDKLTTDILPTRNYRRRWREE